MTTIFCASRTSCNAQSVAARSRDPGQHRTVRIDGPQLCSASSKRRCAASGARKRSGARTLLLVIASAAKQSRVFPRRDSGLLRCARNDGARATQQLSNVHFRFADMRSHPRGAFARALLHRSPLSIQEQLGRSRPAIRRAQGWCWRTPPSAADGLDPVCTPVFGLGMRSAEVRAREGALVRPTCISSDPTSRRERSWC